MGRERPKKRTSTMATVSSSTSGCWAARAISQPAVAIRPMPKTTASAPTTIESATRARGGGDRANSRRTVAITTPPPWPGRRSAGRGRAARPGRAGRSARAGGRSRARRARRPCRAITAPIAVAVAASTFAVGSSRITRRASRANARARAIRWRWPGDTCRPPSPSTVSYPVGSAAMNSSAPAATAAARTCASLAPAFPSRMLAATVSRTSTGRWGTQASCRRHAARSQSARSAPPTVTRPAVGASRPSSTAASVLLPPPLEPTSMTSSPGSICRSTPDSTSPSRAG